MMKVLSLLHALGAVALLFGASAFVSPSRGRRQHRLSSTLHMALTPTGPFCPFRSQAANEIEPRMEAISKAGPEFAMEMSRLQLDLQMGATPDSERLKRVADGLEAAVEQWENLLARLKLSKDFQTREYAKLTQAHFEQHDTSVESTSSAMRWQAACMRAMANNSPPPMPPANVDLAKLMEQASDGDLEKVPPPSMAAMIAAEQITATPFSGDEPAFQSSNVKEEYEQLCRDHMGLIEFGSRYAEFDPLGKIYYIDEMEKIQERWDIFFARFQLMGALNKQYVEQCNAFLASMGLNEEQYRELLKKCHQIMRDEAEAERNLQNL